MDDIINNQLGYPKTADFGAKLDGYNVLNVPNEAYKTPDQFWQEYNKPFLDQIIQRGDPVALATSPKDEVLKFEDGTLRGFGREIEYLQKAGYSYDPSSGQMIRP